MATTRNQPQYDIITGASIPQRPVSRQSNFRSSQTIRGDTNNEELRALLHKLQYEVESLKQERETTALRHEEQLRATQSKADADFKRAQALESTSNAASSKQEALSEKYTAMREEFAGEKAELERRLRVAQDTSNDAREQLEDAQSELQTQERQLKHTIKDLEAKNERLQNDSAALQADNEQKTDALQSTRDDLKLKQEDLGRLENEVMRLKNQASDGDSLVTIKKELSEQVTHIQKLEATNIDQRIELKQLRQHQKAIEVVEEEKRTLESKLEMMNDIRKQLDEAQLRKEILEDERSAWSSYLDDLRTEDDNVSLETPEEIVKAYMQERLGRATLVDELGKIAPELTAKDEIIQSLEQDKANLKSDLEKLRSNGDSAAPDAKAKARLERQRALAIKEADYLRAQLETFDMEKNEFQPENYDAGNSRRVEELEKLVDEYRAETQKLHDDLSKVEGNMQPGSEVEPNIPIIGSKRTREQASGAGDERLGELSRKNRKLQDAYSELKNARTVLDKEVTVLKSQLKAAKSRTSTRILELRANPTAEAEAIKTETLNKLRAENIALLTQLEAANQQSSSISSSKSRPGSSSRNRSANPSASISGDPSSLRTVPYATLERLRADMDARDASIASQEKHMVRLKQIFATKSLEFREAVAAILGWKLDFLPNGRVRVTSMFYPGIKDEATGEEGNSIIFDGENGTMKVSGGPQSPFANEIRSLIEFWVEGRKEIPCFLAACTLEFWEKSTRAIGT